MTWLDLHDPGAAPSASSRLRSRVSALPELATRRQLIHNDYRGSNIVTAESRVAAVLDFDDLTLDHPVYDLANAAVMLGTHFTDWRPTPPAVQQILLSGYRSVRPLTPVEEQWLDALILWRGITAIPAGEDPAAWAAAVESPVTPPAD